MNTSLNLETKFKNFKKILFLFTDIMLGVLIVHSISIDIRIMLSIIMIFLITGIIYRNFPKKIRLNNWYAYSLFEENGRNIYKLYFLPIDKVFYCADGEILIDSRKDAVGKLISMNKDAIIYGETITLCKINSKQSNVQYEKSLRKWTSLKGIFSVLLSIMLTILNIRNIFSGVLCRRLFHIILINKFNRYRYFEK